MKHFLTGNFCLILCCACYLAWWAIAFRPNGAVKGMRSGWLLIPAAVCGIAAVLIICRGIRGTESASLLFPAGRTVIIGVVVYFLLLAVTGLLMKRPVTTELLLIVGWTVLSVTEISALYGRDVFGKTAALALVGCVIVLAAVSLVCYLLYYNLDSIKGYVDGMIPLAIVAVVSVILSIVIKK